MPGELIFRNAETGDWEAIADLLTEAKLPLDGAREWLPEFLLAYRDTILVGTAALEKYGNTVLLRSLAVSTTERGRGVGRELLGHLLDKARAEGFSCGVVLTTTAADYFPHFGFRAVSREEVPEEAKSSVEFQGACPDSAIAMLVDLGM